MKKLLQYVTILAALFVATQTHAATEGLYIRGELGGAFNKLDLDAETNTKKNTFSGGVSIGYDFAITEEISIAPELGYKYIGETKYSIADQSFKVCPHTFDILGVVTYSLNEDFDIFAKAGIAVISTEDIRPGQDRTEAVARPEVAAGLGYNIDENIQLTVAVAHIFKKDAKWENGNNINASAHPTPSITQLTVGIKYSLF